MNVPNLNVQKLVFRLIQFSFSALVPTYTQLVIYFEKKRVKRQKYIAFLKSEK